MPAIFAYEHFGELTRVRQIAVVAETNAVRRIDVERLRVLGAVGACGWVAHMSDADVAFELEHVLLLKYIADQPGVLAHEKFTGLRRHDSRRVLTAVLQDGQRVIDPLIDRTYTDHSDDSAHEGP